MHTDSAHLTLSTYAAWSYGDLGAHVLEAVGHNVTSALAPDTLPLPLRQSPPLGFVFEHSLLHAAATQEGRNASVKELAAALRAFADVGH